MKEFGFTILLCCILVAAVQGVTVLKEILYEVQTTKCYTMFNARVNHGVGDECHLRFNEERYDNYADTGLIPTGPWADEIRERRRNK